MKVTDCQKTALILWCSIDVNNNKNVNKQTRSATRKTATAQANRTFPRSLGRNVRGLLLGHYDAEPLLINQIIIMSYYSNEFSLPKGSIDVSSS